MLYMTCAGCNKDALLKMKKVSCNFQQPMQDVMLC